MNSFPMPSDHFIEIDNRRFHYLDWGGTGFSLIFIPGLGWTPHIFNGIAKYFTDDFHVYGFTRRGHGKSDAPLNCYDIPTLTSDIEGFLNTLSIQSAHFVGHSMVCYEISQLACDSPDRVASLTFLDNSYNPADRKIEVPDPVDAYFPVDEPQSFETYDTNIEFLRKARPDFSKIWCETFELALNETLVFNDDGSVEVICNKDIEELIVKGNRKFRHLYDKICCPALAMYSLYEVSPRLPEDASDEIGLLSKEFVEQYELPWLREQIRLFEKGVSDSKVVEYWNVTHHFYLEREEDVAKEIMNFLQETHRNV